jgi:gamma-glutamylcysteine synthetase
MSARVVNIVIPQGADYQNSFLLEDNNNAPIVLSNYSGICHIKKHPSSKNKIVVNVSFPNPTLGEVKISVASTVTSNIKPGKYVYDVLLTDNSGKKVRVVEGIATVTAGVSTS